MNREQNVQNQHVSQYSSNEMLYAVPFGMQVIINDMACMSKERKQFRFPKSKKVRIRKKWSKRNANYRLEDVHKAIKIGNKLLVSSKMFEILKKLPQA